MSTTSGGDIIIAIYGAYWVLLGAQQSFYVLLIKHRSNETSMHGSEILSTN